MPKVHGSMSNDRGLANTELVVSKQALSLLWCRSRRRFVSMGKKKPLEGSTPNKEKHSFSWTGFVVWSFVVLVLYVLSVGPVMMMFDKGRISPKYEFLEKFYLPLEWAYENTLFHKPFGMYLHLWSKRFDKNGDEK